MKQFTKLEHLNEFADLLLKNGFTLIVMDEQKLDSLSTYFHFWKDENMGYVQSDRFERNRFSTTHKPCKKFGTGFGVLEEYAALTVENALKTLVRIPYQWQNTKGVDKIQFYSSPEEYVNRETVLKFKIVQPVNAQ